MIPYIDTNWSPWLEKEQRGEEGDGKRDKIDIRAAEHLLQKVLLRLRQTRFRGHSRCFSSLNRRLLYVIHISYIVQCISGVSVHSILAIREPLLM